MSIELTFTSGSMDNVTRCVDISIIDDNALEGEETFTVALTTFEHNVVLGNDLLIVTIIDNDG